MESKALALDISTLNMESKALALGALADDDFMLIDIIGNKNH
jgi:hypothetical protein